MYYTQPCYYLTNRAIHQKFYQGVHSIKSGSYGRVYITSDIARPGAIQGTRVQVNSLSNYVSFLNSCWGFTDASRYISGHLINQDFLGNGIEENLTVLTTLANSAHKKVETLLRNVANSIRLNEDPIFLNNASPSHCYFIEYEVIVPDISFLHPTIYTNTDIRCSIFSHIDIAISIKAFAPQQYLNFLYQNRRGGVQNNPIGNNYQMNRFYIEPSLTLALRTNDNVYRYLGYDLQSDCYRFQIHNTDI